VQVQVQAPGESQTNDQNIFFVPLLRQ